MPNSNSSIKRVKKHHTITLVLRWSAFLFVFSRGLLYLIFDSPYRALLWNESLLRPYIENAGHDWTTYANSSDAYIQILEKSIGIFLMLAAVCFLTINPNKSQKLQKIALLSAGVLTTFHILLTYLGHNQHLPILPEYILQGLTPWLFLAFLRSFPAHKSDTFSPPSTELVTTLKIAIALCFIGHGLYALGWPYQPTHFVRFITATFPFINFPTASKITILIGYIDIIVALAIFIPQYAKPALLYITIWGAITALARTTSHIIVPLDLTATNPWFLETTVRTIHAGAPLFLYLLLINKIIPSSQPLRLAIPKPLQNKTTLITISLILALTTYASINHINILNTQQQKFSNRITNLKYQQASLTQKNQTRLEQNLNNPTPESPALTQADFQTNSTNQLYSDLLFSTPNLPIRITINTNQIKDLTPFHQNRATITQTIKKQIITNFHQTQSSPDFTDQQILTFSKNTQLTLKNPNTLLATIHTPWLPTKTLSLEINTNGKVTTP